MNDELLTSAKEYASRTGRTLTSLIEDGLREVLSRQEAGPSRVVNLETSPGGPCQGVNIDNAASLLDLMG